jgi:hypothetical protein
MTEDVKTPEEKLYAGKFKTIEDLEVGYKNSAVVYDENEKLKMQLAEFNAPPDYINPSDIALDESRINDIKARAKEVGMSQAQYEKFLRGDKARVEQRTQNYEQAKKDVGESTLNILKDYVSKNYPEPLRDNILSTFIQNKEARQAALNHRDQLLNNTIPGMNKTSAIGYAVTHDDIQKAYKAKEANKGDMKARQHYLNLLDAQAQQKAG